jgi:hypothetical protein
MSELYRLARREDGLNVTVSEDATDVFDRYAGERLGKAPKVKLEWESDEDDPRDDRRDAYLPEQSLMSDELVAALEEAGVTNLQTFPAKIVDSRNGRAVKGYRIFNLLGPPIDCGHPMEQLRAADVPADALLFRATAYPRALIARKSVADALRPLRLPGLELDALTVVDARGKVSRPRESEAQRARDAQDEDELKALFSDDE